MAGARIIRTVAAMYKRVRRVLLIRYSLPSRKRQWQSPTPAPTTRAKDKAAHERRQTLLSAAQPICGTASNVEAGEDDDGVAFDEIEDSVWKLTQQRAPSLLMHDGISCRIALHGGHASRGCAQELKPQALAPLFVPTKRLFNFGSSFRADYDTVRHARFSTFS